MKIWTRVHGGTTENVWLGTELLELPKQCCLWFMSQGDWYPHHYTPKLPLMKQLSWKMCLLPDTLCGLFQVFSLWAWWENRDKTMATMRQERQLRVSSPFIFSERGRKLWRTSEGFSRCCSVVFSFQESLEFLHNSRSAQPAVVSFSIQSLNFFCLGCNPVISLSLWSSITFLCFDLRKSKHWRMLLFK